MFGKGVKIGAEFAIQKVGTKLGGISHEEEKQGEYVPPS